MEESVKWAHCLKIRPCGGADIPAGSYVRVYTYAWQSKLALVAMAHTPSTHSMLPAALPAPPHGRYYLQLQGESHLLTAVLVWSCFYAIQSARESDFPAQLADQCRCTGGQGLRRKHFLGFLAVRDQEEIPDHFQVVR